VSAATELALAAIERRGILLVYPLANRPEPRSLWGELYPRTPMRWSWDAGADARVARLWRLREELARSEEVVYGKWFRGRATFFARSVFRAMLAALARETGGAGLGAGLSRRAAMLLDLLEDNSPQSTKELRANADLQGRANEAAYTGALKELWSRLLVVGVGEVQDGAFPSLNISATKLRFEDLWPRSADGGRGGEDSREKKERARDAERLATVLAAAPLFARELDKTLAAVRASKRGERPLAVE
jgi:hypothetical protein